MGIYREVGQGAVECHMRAMPTLSANDGPEFHSDMPVSELAEHDTRAIKASVVSSAPLIVKTMDGVMYETRPSPMGLEGLSRLTQTQEST